MDGTVRKHPSALGRGRWAPARSCAGAGAEVGIGSAREPRGAWLCAANWPRGASGHMPAVHRGLGLGLCVGDAIVPPLGHLRALRSASESKSDSTDPPPLSTEPPRLHTPRPTDAPPFPQTPPPHKPFPILTL